MELKEISKEQQLIAQMVWGDKKIEFYTKVIGYEEEGEGVYIEPYRHNHHPLDLNITIGCGVFFHLFTDDPSTRNRISWRSVEVHTVDYLGKKVHLITTSSFNKLSQTDERRTHERIQIHQMGKVTDVDGNELSVRVHDVSDNGVSFYAPVSFAPRSPHLVVQFADSVRGEAFELKVNAKIVHSTTKTGAALYGCEIADANREYLLYGCLKRVMHNKNNKEG